MLQKGNALYSILKGKCPKCHRESMYKNPNPYALSELFKMYERCSHCGTRYKMEPSFFYGAMYVSYALGVAFAIAVFVIAAVFFHASLPHTFIAIVLTLVAGMPLLVRLSRNIWINFFIRYDPKAGKDQQG